ncbi:hypothetical protein [Neopusillimonas aromaticivorans]|nr:hypothetical protein [Neopusillimonas aromaticivorans]WJJ92720.1 hypothetical protein N7E01_10405 [Neopusillimonas aromaticivorans]
MLTPEVIAQLVEAAKEVSRGEPVPEWVAWRDRGLVDVLKLQENLGV